MKRTLISMTALIFLTASAIAADHGGSGGSGGNSGGGGGDGGSSGTADTQCYNDKVYDKRKKKCVRPKAQPDNG